MPLTIMSWNMAGARVFGQLDESSPSATGTFVRDFRQAWRGIAEYLRPALAGEPGPDVIFLQECIGFVDHRGEPSGQWHTGQQILAEIFPDYKCFFFPAFSSATHPSPARWNRFRQGGGMRAPVPPEIEAQQGCGICVRDPSWLRRLWVGEPDPAGLAPQVDLPGDATALCFEATSLSQGLYLGNRNTEPRLFVLGRLKLPGDRGGRYVNVLNVHLATVVGEREGKPDRDALGTRRRQQHLDLLLDEVISAYQEAQQYRVPRRTADRGEDLWIIAGDFNAMPASPELEMIRHAGFVDGNPDKRLVDVTGTFQDSIGTKWSSGHPNAPPIAIDYILCGLKGVAFAPGCLDARGSLRPYRPAFPPGSPFEPDHAVLFASFAIS